MPARSPQAQPVLLVRHKAGIIQENYDDVSEEEMKDSIFSGEIVVKWVLENEALTGHKKSMLVIASDHPRFVVGSRFDYGFFNIATDEGYKIISLPLMSMEGA